MKVLVTGVAGFIGSYVVHKLVQQGHTVVGLDCINSYYDVRLKYDRLSLQGIEQESISYNKVVQSSKYLQYSFIKLNVEDGSGMDSLFQNEKFDRVCHLAAQAGVRYSLENPRAYIDSNITGFLNILESCRENGVNYLVYASSSSVYGANTKVPFCESDVTDTPVSLYAVTKKTNEQMALVYSKLYNLSCVGLRFFTVYGPWGRPDMAPMLFAKAISNGEAINVFNEGKLSRDFTFIDDIVDGISRVVNVSSVEAGTSRVYNIGCSSPVELMDFINTIEANIGVKAKMNMLPMQKGDVYKTYADTSLLEKDFGYKPQVKIGQGIAKFIAWYKQYYNEEYSDFSSDSQKGWS